MTSTHLNNLKQTNGTFGLCYHAKSDSPHGGVPKKIFSETVPHSLDSKRPHDIIDK